MAQVRTTQAADYMTLLAEVCAHERCRSFCNHTPPPRPILGRHAAASCWTITLKELRLPTVHPCASTTRWRGSAPSSRWTINTTCCASQELELLDRERRATERRIRQAKFPVVKTMDSFDFLAIPSLNKTLVLELARCPSSSPAQGRTSCSWATKWNWKNAHRPGSGSGCLPAWPPRALYYHRRPGQRVDRGSRRQEAAFAFRSRSPATNCARSSMN